MKKIKKYSEFHNLKVLHFKIDPPTCHCVHCMAIKLLGKSFDLPTFYLNTHLQGT